MKNPKEEWLEIPIQVTQYFIDHDDYLMRRSKITSLTKASKGALDFLSQAEKLIKKDKANIRKCLAFVSRRFPHVGYKVSELWICLENISREEIVICRRQRGLKFNYFSAEDN